MGTHLRTSNLARQNPRAASVKAIHQRSVELWVEYLIDSGDVPVGYKLEKGSSAPGITMIKKFILWYYACFTRRRLQPDGRATVIATLVCAERFFSGFEAATGNRVAPADRSEIYRVSIAEAAKIDDAGRGLPFHSGSDWVEWPLRLYEGSLKRYKY